MRESLRDTITAKARAAANTLRGVSMDIYTDIREMNTPSVSEIPNTNISEISNTDIPEKPHQDRTVVGWTDAPPTATSTTVSFTVPTTATPTRTEPTGVTENAPMPESITEPAPEDPVYDTQIPASASTSTPKPIPTPTQDKVNRPNYYCKQGIELGEVLYVWGIPHRRASAVEYIMRAGEKDASTEIEDLRKAIRNLEMEIDFLQRYGRR